MNVIDALRARSTVRAYKHDPVGKDTILKILEAATRAPSWANTQPWEIFVAAGEALERLRTEYTLRLRNVYHPIRICQHRRSGHLSATAYGRTDVRTGSTNTHG